MVDDYLATTAGERVALLSQLGQGAKALAVVTATIASYMPFPGMGNLGDMALYALGEMSGEEMAAGIALGLIPGGKLLGGLGKFLGGIGSSAWSAAKHYASRYTGALANKVSGLFARAKQFINRKPGTACGCFAAGTLVWTLQGLTGIDMMGDLWTAMTKQGWLLGP